VENLSILVLPDLKDHRVQAGTHPADSPLLPRHIRTWIEPVRLEEQLLYFLEPDAALSICSEKLALSAGRK
jgi:hypothetical protein